MKSPDTLPLSLRLGPGTKNTIIAFYCLIIGFGVIANLAIVMAFVTKKVTNNFAIVMAFSSNRPTGPIRS